MRYGLATGPLTQWRAMSLTRTRRGDVDDPTGVHHLERALELRHAVTAALANWDALGFDGLLGGLGSALNADAVTVWLARDAGLRPLRTWRADDEAAPATPERPSAAVVRASHRGLAVLGQARTEIAFPIVTMSGVLAVVELRTSGGPRVTDTLARVLGSIGREVGAFFAARPCDPDGPRLSPREREVLELVAEGLSAPEIAARLVLSPATVRSHLRNIFSKLEVGDRVSAVVKAMRAGLVR